MSWVPRPIPVLEPTEPPESNRNAELLLLVLEGVGGGIEVSINDAVPFARSSLLPISRNVQSGDASARASFRKVGKDVKDEREVIS
jgi:hypothetical protein